MGAQTLKLKMATEVTENGDSLVVVDTMALPMGEIKDETILDKKSLVLVKRTINQGPVSIAFEMKGNKAVGSMKFQGQEKPIDVDLGGPLFADAAGAPNSIGCLPLAENYTTTFRNFDVQKQKPKLMQLKVVGTESVTVPAGTFDTYKIEITPADGGTDKMTLWVARDSRKPVKLSSIISQMNGATMTAELQ
jgi:hypothetical protein